MTDRFVVTQSVHGMPSVQLTDASDAERALILRSIHANRIDDPWYQLRTKAGAFLQGDDGPWILVEFWQKDYAPYVAALNSALSEV